MDKNIEKFGFCDKITGFVVVFNKNSPINKLRHIVRIREIYDVKDFKIWYYAKFCRLPGDRFKFCRTESALKRLLNRLEDDSYVWR